MSPRRKVAGDEPDLFAVSSSPPRRWRLPVFAGVVAVLITAGIVASILMVVAHQRDRRVELNDASALG